jgi:hypothetical protein
MNISTKFRRLMPTTKPPDEVWDLIGMVIHMTNTKEWMDIFQIQSQLLKYYADDNYDGIAAEELSIMFIETALYLAHSYGLMEIQ